MLTKIYYIIGGVLIGIYLIVNLIALVPDRAVPRAQEIKKARMERGKYVYVAPSYLNDNPYSGSSSSGRSTSTSSYPRTGGYSGGK